MRRAIERHTDHKVESIFSAHGFRWIFAAFVALGFADRVGAESIGIEQAIREACTKSDSVKMMKETLRKSKEIVREKRSNAFPDIAGSAYAVRNRSSFAAGGGGGGGSMSSRQSVASAELEPVETDPSFSVFPVDTPPPYVTWQALQAIFSNFSKPQYSTVYGTGLSITQPIYTFGKIGTAIKVAKTFDRSVQYTYKRNLQTLQLSALDAFIDAAMTEKYVREAERSLRRNTEVYEFLEKNFQLGSGNKGQVLSTKADVISLSSTVLSAKRAAHLARMWLNFEMGRPLTDSSALDTVSVPEGLFEASPPEYDSAARIAFDGRLDLKSLDLLAESNKGGAKIFKSMYLPSIAGTGSIGYSRYDAGSSLFKNDGTTNWSIGVVMQWMLFDGFENSAKAAQFMSDARKLELVRGQLSKGLEIEIRDALKVCVIADSDYVAAKEKLVAARESYDITNSNFKQGSGQLLELLRVDGQLFGAELGVANARYRKVRSRAALRVAMGRDIVRVEER